MMAEDQRPEVNLEISSGFFRIPTEKLIYNLTVIGGGGVQVVERIVERERQAEEAPPPPTAVPPPAGGALLPLVRRELTAAVRRGLETHASELDRIITALSQVRGALAGGGGDGVAAVAATLDEAAGLLAELEGGEESPPSPPPAEPSPPRYLFDLDVVFQTLYELCTNEQVKSHIITARENRDTYFDNEVFQAEINRVVAPLEPDGDNFFNVPMSELLAALLAGCNEKPIQNLLKKMDASQGAIFLDQFLPLEVPPLAEPAEESPAPPPPATAGEGVGARVASMLRQAREQLAGGATPAADVTQRLSEVETMVAELAVPAVLRDNLALLLALDEAGDDEAALSGALERAREKVAGADIVTLTALLADVAGPA